MKKLLYFAFFSFFAFFGTVIADTLNIDWLVDGETYSSTTCNYGDDLILPNTPTKYGYTFVGWEPKFTKIEYIESTGTQWIDTGYSAPNGYRANIKFVVNQYSYLTAIMGSHNNNSPFGRNNLYTTLVKNTDKHCLFVGAGGTYVVSDFCPLQLYTPIDLIFTTFTDNISVDGHELTYKSDKQSVRSSLSLFVFWQNGYSSASRLEGRIYYVKIWDDNDVLVRDFIPVLDDNGVACMYDKVSGQFFYNAGTGDFIAGPTISE